MRAAGRTAQITQAKAATALTCLLYGCTKERLAGFTAQGLSGSYNVPVAKAEEMLARARQGRLL
jgi:hypothetical protein